MQLCFCLKNQSLIMIFIYFSKIVVFVSVNRCTPNPCQHGGTCRNRGQGRYECICRRLYHGEHCEKGELLG